MFNNLYCKCQTCVLVRRGETFKMQLATPIDLTVALNFETHSLLSMWVGANVTTGCMAVWSADSLCALAALSNSLKCNMCFPLVTMPSPYWFSSNGSLTPWLSSYNSRRWSYNIRTYKYINIKYGRLYLSVVLKFENILNQ